MDPLICDVYQFDLGGRPNLDALAAAGDPWHGCIFKATEGLRYAATSWLAPLWERAKGLRKRGAYLYLHFDQDPVKQAERFISVVECCGGHRPGDLPPTIDVERAGNPAVTAHQLINVVSIAAMRLRKEYGVGPTLYGGELIRGLGITDHMGCDRLWVARYTQTLPVEVYRDMGWQFPFMWQYDGDGESHLVGYPQTSPMGRCDISAVTDHGEYAKAVIP